MTHATSRKIEGSSASGIIYVYGNENTDGSLRLTHDGNIMCPEKRTEGIWKPSSFEVGPGTLWIDKAVGIAKAGHHLLSESASGEFHLPAHSDFDGSLSLSDAKTLYAYYLSEHQITQSDYSNEWIGTEFSWSEQSTIHGLLKKGYWKTGSIPATQPIRIQTWEGIDENGVLIFDQKYPASDFIINTEIGTIEDGFIELTPGQDYFTKISSEGNFSLLTNAEETKPWNAIDLISVRYDNLLQTPEWVDGANYIDGQYFINNRKIYVCNITGIQTGTFEENSDKWDLLEGRYIEGIFTENSIPFADANGKLTEDNPNLFYDSLFYLHSPRLAIYDDEPILKRGHGLSLIFNEENEFEIIHVNTPIKSAYLKYDPSVDKFKFDKILQVNGLDVLTSESDPTFTVWESGFTEGSLIFADANGLVESNNKLFWDNSNKRFGIGLNTPARAVHLQDDNATFRIDRDTNSPAVQLHRFPNNDYTTPWKGFVFGVNATGADDGTFFIKDFHQNVSGSGDNRLTIDTNGNIVIPGALDMGGIISGDGSGLINLVEADPIFTAWDKSTGISIAISQVSDHSYAALNLTGLSQNRIPYGVATGGLIDSSNLTYSDSALRVSNGGIYLDRTGADSFIAFKRSGTQVGQIRGADGSIDITESGGSPVHLSVDVASGITTMTGVDTSKIGNSGGILKLNPDATGIVELFGDADVGNDENGRMLYVWRRAAEGNEYIRFYISANQKSYIHTSCPMTLQAQVDFTINSVTEDIIFKVGDNAGVKKFYFRDSDGTNVATIDSDGNGWFAKNVGIGTSPSAIINLDVADANPIIRLGSTKNGEWIVGERLGGLEFYGSDGSSPGIGVKAEIDVLAKTTYGNWFDIVFKIQDQAGVLTEVMRLLQNGSVDIANSLTIGNDIIVTDDIFAYGDIAGRNLITESAIVFQDKSTQEEASERHFSQGHTHTAVYNDDWYDADSENISERDIHFSPDGLTMYIIGLANSGTGDCSIWEYSLINPWDLSTVGSPTIENIETYGSNQVGIFISLNGRRLWTVCTSNDTVIEYSMSPWNISSLSWVQAKDISGQETSPSALFWSANGDRLFVAGDSDNNIVAFSVTNEWDISGISWFEDFGTDINAPTGLHFSSDGRRMYVMDGSAEDDIHEFHLASPWRISSAKLVNLFNVSSENSSPQGIFLTPDNSKIFMVGTGTPDGVYGYNLGLEVGGKIITGTLKITALPTSDPSDTGVLWNDNGVVKVSL